MWGATAAEALRRKKEREQQIEDYYRSRSKKVEAEGNPSTTLRAGGGRLTGKQIAQAYRRSMQEFKKKLQEDGLSASEADDFVEQARANGSISSVQKAAGEYAAQKAQEQAERAAAYRTWRVEETTCTPPPPPPQSAPDLQTGTAGANGWYIWESADFIVKDDYSQVVAVSYEIRDRQNLWKKVECFL